MLAHVMHGGRVLCWQRQGRMWDISSLPGDPQPRITGWLSERDVGGDRWAANVSPPNGYPHWPLFEHAIWGASHMSCVQPLSC